MVKGEVTDVWSAICDRVISQRAACPTALTKPASFALYAACSRRVKRATRRKLTAAFNAILFCRASTVGIRFGARWCGTGSRCTTKARRQRFITACCRKKVIAAYFWVANAHGFIASTLKVIERARSRNANPRVTLKAFFAGTERNFGGTWQKLASTINTCKAINARAVWVLRRTAWFYANAAFANKCRIFTKPVWVNRLTGIRQTRALAIAK